MDLVGFRLERPPVRFVRLTLMLDPDEPLTAADVDGLVHRWRGVYPLVTQLPPIIATDSAPDLSLNWPVPYTILDSESGGRRLCYQGDRFMVEWEFSGKPGEYPGYESLRTELLERFEELQTTVEQNSNRDMPSCVAAEAEYMNDLGTGAVADVLKFGTRVSSAGPQYNWYGRHYHPRGPGSSGAWIDLRDDPDQGLELRIRVRWDVDDEDGADHVALINRCHSEVIEAFVAWTTEDMRAQWQ